jgi:hypothetical protein
MARQFEALLERRVRGLARVVITNVPSGAEDLGEEMLRFWIEHRLAVVVLLDRAEGTPFADFGDRFVEQLLSATIANLRAETPQVRVTPAARFVLARIFENTRRMLAAILETHHDERALRNAIEGFWSYQIPGLRGFADGTGAPAARVRWPGGSVGGRRRSAVRALGGASPALTDSIAHICGEAVGRFGGPDVDGASSVALGIISRE